MTAIHHVQNACERIATFICIQSGNSDMAFHNLPAHNSICSFVHLSFTDTTVTGDWSAPVQQKVIHKDYYTAIRNVTDAR